MKFRRLPDARRHRGDGGCGSSLFSMEWPFGQPAGRKRIAQRFIAGWAGSRGEEVPQGRQNSPPRLTGWKVAFFRPWRDFVRVGRAAPSDESPGYFRSSLRDWTGRLSREAPLPCRERLGSIPPKTAKNQPDIHGRLRIKELRSRLRRQRTQSTVRRCQITLLSTRIKGWRSQIRPLRS